MGKEDIVSLIPSGAWVTQDKFLYKIFFPPFRPRNSEKITPDFRTNKLTNQFSIA
jgi:hypothetical protein